MFITSEKINILKINNGRNILKQIKEDKNSILSIIRLKKNVYSGIFKSIRAYKKVYVYIWYPIRLNNG